MSHKGSPAPCMLVKAGGQSIHKTSIGFGTLHTDWCELIAVGHHPHVPTFCLATWHCPMSPLMTRSHRTFPFIFAYCKDCKWSKTGWWIGLRTTWLSSQSPSRAWHLWRAECSLENAYGSRGFTYCCRTKRSNTQCSVAHINCLNMLKTGGREDIDLAEMALEVITQLDMDTDEFRDCCWSWWGHGKCDS